MAKILLVEDDPVLADTLCLTLGALGHKVDWAADGAAADDFITAYKYELLILDWDVPVKTGIELLKEFRAKGGSTQALVLTGRTESRHKVVGLDSGADDYLTKPFDADELAARVRALLRRVAPAKSTVFNVRDVEVDTAAHAVRRGGQAVDLTPLEFSLLEFLVRHKGTLFSQEALLDRVWDSKSDAAGDMVRATVKRIRKKLGESGEQSIIRTVFGQGYVVDPD